MAKKTYPIEIRFSDVDSLSHVNNAVYFTYFEQARMHFFKDVLGVNWDWSEEGVLLARNEADYLAPLFLYDRASIEIWISNIGNKSMEMSYRIYKVLEGKEITCTRGKSVLVSFDFTTQKSIPLPDVWKKLAIVKDAH